MAHIKSWSYSRLVDFEECAYRAFLKHVERIRSESGPAAERGTAIHQLAEDYVGGKIKNLPSELMKFKAEFESLRLKFKAGLVSLEGEWGFDKQWGVVDYKTAYGRVKGDAVVFNEDKTHAIVIDYKTGKRFGNELKHGEQCQLYAIATFIRYPTVKTIDTELWYLDLDDLHNTPYSRLEYPRYALQFEKRINKMTSAKEFPPSANVFSCKWCDFGPSKGGQCTAGVLPGDNALKQYRRRFG